PRWRPRPARRSAASAPTCATAAFRRPSTGSDVETLTRIHDVRAAVSAARAANQRVAFVPTMCALHEGHLSLVERARAEAALVVVSVFVNPLQFGPTEDFARYPRDLGRDADLLATAGAHVLFAPSVD